MENNNLNQEAVQEMEQQIVPETASEPQKTKKQLRKEKKRAKKLERKQLRKAIRQRKKDEFRAKGCLGKIFWFFGKLISLILVAAMLFTVVRVNYANVAGYLLSRYFISAVACCCVIQNLLGRGTVCNCSEMR